MGILDRILAEFYGCQCVDGSTTPIEVKPTVDGIMTH
jgi:hypothetical protein